MLENAGWSPDVGRGRLRWRRFAGQRLLAGAGRALANGKAAARWLLMGEQHLDGAHARWGIARRSQKWTQRAERCAEWLAGSVWQAKSRARGPLAGWATPVTVFPVAPLGGQDEFLVALEDATMAAMGAEAALEELMEESVPAVMVLCEEIMYLAPLTTEDDKLLGLSLEMARAASTAAEHTLQRALAVEADIDKLVAYISVRAGKIESVRAAMAKQQTGDWSASGGPSRSKEDVAVRDLAVAVVAALATALKEMRAKAVIERDRVCWANLGSRRRCKQALREEREAEAALWVGALSERWWQDLAAAAADMPAAGSDSDLDDGDEDDDDDSGFDYLEPDSNSDSDSESGSGAGSAPTEGGTGSGGAGSGGSGETDTTGHHSRRDSGGHDDGRAHSPDGSTDMGAGAAANRSELKGAESWGMQWQNQRGPKLLGEGEERKREGRHQAAAGWRSGAECYEAGWWARRMRRRSWSWRKLLARPTWDQRSRGAVEPAELMSCGVEKDDGLSDHRRGRRPTNVYSMHNTHLHTRDRSWRSVDDDDHDDQDTTSTTSPAFEVRLESDQLCQNHSVVHSLTGCNEHA